MLISNSIQNLCQTKISLTTKIQARKAEISWNVHKTLNLTFSKAMEGLKRISAQCSKSELNFPH